MTVKRNSGTVKKKVGNLKFCISNVSEKNYNKRKERKGPELPPGISIIKTKPLVF